MKKKRNEKEVHLFKVFGALLCATALLWFPLTVVTMLFFFGVAVNASSVASKVLFYCQATFHPIIETILIKVRKPLKIIFFSCCNGVKNKLVSNTDSDGHLNDESGAGTSSTCYRHARDFLDVCRAALLFDQSQHETNNTKESISSNTAEPVHVVSCEMQSPS